jgi:hypothetical protein
VLLGIKQFSQGGVMFLIAGMEGGGVSGGLMLANHLVRCL